MSDEDKAADKVVADCYDCADLIGLDRDIQKLVHIVNARVTVFGPQWEVRLVKFQELKALLTVSHKLAAHMSIEHPAMGEFVRALRAFKDFE